MKGSLEHKCDIAVRNYKDMLFLSHKNSLRETIGQFEDFEMSDQPMVRLLRFHQHLSQLEGHRPWLIHALQDSMNSSLEEKLIAA